MKFTAADLDSEWKRNDWCSHITPSDVSSVAPYFDFFNSSAMVKTDWQSAKPLVLRESEYDAPQCKMSTEKPQHVFGIGLSKTGTSSLGLALRQLGYKNAYVAFVIQAQ